MKSYKNNLLIILFIISLTISFSITCYAKLYRIRFMWDANTEPDLLEYRLYQSTISGNYDMLDPVLTISANNTCDITTDISDKTYWVLTAVDTSLNESDYSNEVYYEPDLEAPNRPNYFQLFFVYPIIDAPRGNITTIINNTINNNIGN